MHAPVCPCSYPDGRRLARSEFVLGWSRYRAIGLVLLLGLGLPWFAISAFADSTVVFNEIMYHPQTNEAALEWIELFNQMAVDMDISGWSIQGGVQFTFPEGSILPGGHYLVVAASPDTLKAATGLTNVAGPFTGRLGNHGETLELRNNNQRLMDSVDYSDEDDWPVGADGSGISLAKIAPNSASAPPANWTVSAQAGGTPGAPNFTSGPLTGKTTRLLNYNDNWKYDDAGIDRGSSWRDPAYDDQAWKYGPGLFALGGSSLPGPKGTDLASGPNTYYFRTTFDCAEVNTSALLNLSFIVDDGAVVYLNGAEVYRYNLPAGPITFSTLALSGVLDPQPFGPISLPANALVAGRNVLAVEVHQGPPLPPNSGLTIEPASGYSIAWDGTDGLYYDTQPQSGPPDNLALASKGTIPFGSSEYNGGGIHMIVNVNDGLYGNSHSWLANFLTGDPNPYIGLRFPGQVAIAGIAWGRDNTGQYNDRWQGTYTIQVTRVANPGGSTAETGNPATGWAVLGTIDYSSSSTGFRPWVRHRFDLAANGQPVPVTGLRIKVSDPNIDIDELEVYPEASNGNEDIAFGAELETTELLAGAARIAFNEIAPASATPFWFELVNYNQHPVDLSNYVVTCSGDTGPARLLPSQTLGPGECLVVTQSLTGYRPQPDDKLFLYPPDRQSVLDAATVKGTLQGRFPQATGQWLYPDQPTPGATNHFVFHDEIVINEIMYHHPPVIASPEVVTTTNLFPIDCAWQYNQSGSNPGAAWLSPDYDDHAWPTGQGLLYNETALLPAPTNTYLNLGPITYYFRTRFLFAGNANQVQLYLNAVVDDGAVFYLNGHEVYRLNMPDGPIDSTTFAASSVADAAYSGLLPISSEYLLTGTNVLAAEVHQGTATSSDVVFGATLIANMELKPAEAFRESPESWIELYNRGTNTVDLAGWTLAGGIEYHFPPRTMLEPDNYLVVAKDADYLKSLYPDITILGNFDKRLSHRSDRILLKDAFGNPSDDVTYFDDGNWPAYADGGNSSLELRDPRADNSKAEAWAASDESAKSQWQNYSYRGNANTEYPHERWNEFVLGLLGDGEVLLDDLSVVESPSGAATQKLQNGSFTAGANGWRFTGNHDNSRVINDPDNPANPVLDLIATGATEDRANHIETTFLNNQPVANGRQYQISFRAKWIAGAQFLHSRLYFNRLSRRIELEVPKSIGTPGARNSRFEVNIGPTYSNLKHTPVAPAPGEGVTVSVKPGDPDGVAALVLWWSVNNGAWSSTPMEAASDGSFSGTIPGQAAGRIVQFYVEGRDSRNASSTFPARGRNSRALFKVPDSVPLADKKHSLQILVTPADVSHLYDLTNVLSNQDTGCTVVYDGQEVFYDAGVRLDGSPAARQSSIYVGFALTFPPDHLFRGVHETVYMDRSGRGALVANGQEEILIKHMINHAGGIPGMYDDLVYVLAPRSSENGPALLMMAGYDQVYLESQYENGADGMEFNYDLIYQMNNTSGDPVQGYKIPVGYIHPNYNVDMENLGDDQETYRWYFRILNGRERDDYTGLIRFLKSMSLNGAALDAATRQTMDVDEWIRAFAMTSLAGVGGDTYGRGLNHNLKLYVRPSDQKVLAFPWDMDNSAFGLSTSASLWGDGNLTKVIVLPANQRLYYGHLLDLMNSTFNTQYMSYWTAHYSGLLPGVGLDGALSYITARSSYVRRQLPARVSFAIQTNAGHDFMVDTPTTVINGSAWIDVKSVTLQLNPTPVNLAWSSITNWQTTVPLVLGTNLLNFVAHDFQDKPIASRAINVTCTALGGATDSDHDGMPDSWELAHGLGPKYAGDANDDDDG
ncbi:MAG: lamin tail domain-containing protein, partial [Candidatus Omnitrophica bacterium]|nr:lamin tail domain-containing protein [Candidatus Omnitrophota bacterium]